MEWRCTKVIHNETHVNLNSSMSTHNFLEEINIDIPIAINVEQIHKIKTYLKYKLDDKDKDEIYWKKNGFRKFMKSMK